MKFNRKFSIGGFGFFEASPVYIIAEAGVNHGGDMQIARQLVDVAAEAGANAVKFQAFRTENLILGNVEKAPYQKKTTDAAESQFQMLKKLELSKSHYAELKEYCHKKNITFLITPFDEGSLYELEETGVEAYKIASTDTTNLPFLKKIAQTGKPLLLSTGMCYLDEIRVALEEIYPWNKNVVLLQCTANYPIADEEANLRVIETFKKEFDMLVGYSDHSVGIGAAPYAVPMGVCAVEKHFTLDKNQPGPDHSASLDPQELKDFVKQIRQIEKYMGSAVKEPVEAEKFTRNSLQKCLVAAREIKTGDRFTEESFVAKRTGGKGISPLLYKKLLSQNATRSYNINDIIDEKI
ncbi:MAG: N-acetylneuraminate synthase [Bacteroidota bacterium]